MATRQGIPLNEATLAAMEEGERDFWEGFLNQASEEIDQCKESGANQPFRPTESLRAKYAAATSVHQGEKYCQVQQLKEIFAF